MTLKIIKKGSGRSGIKPFFFKEGNGGDAPEEARWPEFITAGAADAAAAAAEMAGLLPAAPDSDTGAETEAEPAPDIDKIEREAYERGYAAGRDEAEKVAAAQLEAVAQRYAAGWRDLTGLKATLRAQVEREVVRLALAVAKKIVYREIHIDPTIMQTLVRVALERVAGNPAITVRLNPRDYEYMTRHQEALNRRDVTFASDSAVTPGSCLIQTENGDIDARIEEEFKEVEGAFFEGMD